MKLLVISDTHFHHDPRICDFSGEYTREFTRLLDHHTHDLVVLNGDIFDITQGCNIELWRQRNQDLAMAIEYCVDYRLKGNHDPVDTQIGSEKVGRSLQVGSTRIFHGDVFDLFNGGALWWVGQVGSFFAAAAELTHRDADFYLRKKARSFLNYGRYGGRDAYAGCARKWVRSREEDTLVLGHTHDPDYRLFLGGKYHNSGCFCNHSADSVILEIPDNAEVTLWH